MHTVRHGRVVTVTSQRLWDAWYKVDKAAGHGGTADRLRRAMDEFRAAALASLIEEAILRDDLQTREEVQACAHRRGRDCPGDAWPHGCYNHRAHRAWEYQHNTEVYARADARKAGLA